MGNIRVHELAKSLGGETSKVLSALESMGVKATNMSEVDEELSEKVRRKLSAKAPTLPDGEKAGREGQEGSEAAPRKKRIVAVFRPQNSRSGMMS